MDSIASILGDKDFDQPTEIVSLKKYLKQEFGIEAILQIRDKDIVVNVNNAALANTLRLRSPEIKRHCQLSKKLTFRIS